MNKQATALFARTFRENLEKDGFTALRSYDWKRRFAELDLEDMRVCIANKPAEVKRMSSHDDMQELTGITSIYVLAASLMEQCSNLMATNSDDNDALAWLIAALERLEDLANKKPQTHLLVKYQYEDVVEQTVADFCERALPGEELPLLVEYDTQAELVLDASSHVITCTIPLSDGDVYLSFSITQSTWHYVGQNPDDRAPQASTLHAERTIQNNGTDEEIHLVWNDERGIWQQQEN